MPLRGLLFDFDGLLVDTETSSRASWEELYRRHGQELPLDREELTAERRAYELSLADMEKLRPGVLEYLDAAGRHGLATAVVSSGERWWVDRHLGRLERAEHFDAIVTADGDRERAKPQPTLYLEALSQLELGADEAVAFEDSVNGVRAAKAAGLFCVAVPNGVTAAMTLDEADVLVPSLAELPFESLLARFA